MALYNVMLNPADLKEKNGTLCSFIVSPIVNIMYLYASSKTYKRLVTTKVLILKMKFYKTTRQRLLLSFTRIVLSNGFCPVRIIGSIVWFTLVQTISFPGLGELKYLTSLLPLAPSQLRGLLACLMGAKNLNLNPSEYHSVPFSGPFGIS